MKITNKYYCHEHSFSGGAPCDCQVPKAWEGDREYFNGKIAVIERDQEDTKAVVRRLQAEVGELREVVYQATGVWADLKEILTRERATEASETDYPTFRTCSCGDDLCEPLRTEITHKEANGN